MLPKQHFTRNGFGRPAETLRSETSSYTLSVPETASVQLTSRRFIYPPLLVSCWASTSTLSRYTLLLCHTTDYQLPEPGESRHFGYVEPPPCAPRQITTAGRVCLCALYLLPLFKAPVGGVTELLNVWHGVGRDAAWEEGVAETGWGVAVVLVEEMRRYGN